LLLSVLLRPDRLDPPLPIDRLHLVTAAVALAGAGAVEAVAGFRPGLKWPNDLVVVADSRAGADSRPGTDRKLAGVLAEVDGSAVVVGIGINVNWPADLPDELSAIATACNHVIAARSDHLQADAGAVVDAVVDRDALLAALLDRLADLYGDWPAVAREYRRNCATLHRHVRVDLSDESFTGTAADLTDDGHLIVDTGACLRTVSAGDVVHLRAVP
jgi:BirA family biotin operon repressor/biotin-[acetyl-CoA-carboxylase] ligase